MNVVTDGITLERDNMNNFHFKFPDGARQRASMSEVLLWQVAINTKGISNDLCIVHEELVYIRQKL